MKPRSVAWIVAISFPLWFVPLWVGCWKLAGLNYLGLTTATGGLLLIMTSVGARTDFQTARIPNWITYTGALWAFALNGFHTWVGNETTNQWLGTIGIGQSLVGFAILFFGMFVVFSFSGGGAGDVKMVGSIGAFLGIANGFEAVMLSYICGAMISIGQLFFCRTSSVQAANSTQADLAGGRILVPGIGDGSEDNGVAEPTDIWKRTIRLGPVFAVGTILVLCRESGLIEFSFIGN